MGPLQAEALCFASKALLKLKPDQLPKFNRLTHFLIPPPSCSKLRCRPSRNRTLRWNETALPIRARSTPHGGAGRGRKRGRSERAAIIALGKTSRTS